MSVINTNITSMIGQQNLNESKNALQTSMERLSSGLRINSAKDDAAGQAIANRMSSQITGLSQAQRNANDGISLAQTAEGGLNQINDNLQRVRELTVQAQNGTNSASDIDSIQQEVNQRLEEIDRIARETDFNGTKVLDVNSETKIKIQVGSQDNQAIDITINDQGDWNQYNAGGAVPTGAVNGESRSVEALGFDVLSSAPASLTLGTTGDTIATDDIVTNASTAGNSFDPSGTGELVSYSNSAGETAYAVIDTSGSSNAVAVNFEADGTAVYGEQLSGTNKFLAEDTDNYTILSDTNNVTTNGDSDALTKLDEALAAVDEQRSSLGAIQNRFESAITNLSTNETNLSAARSRIEDADYATEVANMTKNQILQQAGTSVLAQANQLPQSALSLLG